MSIVRGQFSEVSERSSTITTLSFRCDGALDLGMVTRTPTESVTRSSRKEGLLYLSVLVAGLALTAAWWLPFAKPSSVLGRFNYWQVLTLIGSAAVFVSLLASVINRPARRRIAGFRVVAAWLGVVFSLGGVELACFAWPPGHPEKNHWYVSAKPGEDGLPFRRPAGIRWSGRVPGDTTYGADPTAKPITFETDSNGFRNSETPRQADYVFIGDSFTEGCGVNANDSFVQLLQDELTSSVANLGRSAYSPGPELTVLKNYGLPLKPKTVVWQLCEGNDLEDGATWLYWTRNGRPPFYAEGEQHRLTRSAAWKLRSPTWLLYASLREWPWEGRFPDRSGQSISVRFFRPLHPVYHCPQKHPGWDVTVESLTQGHELLRKQGVRLVVVLMPVKLTVLIPFVKLDPEMRTELLGQWRAPPDATWSNYLSAFCSERKIDYIDLTEPLSDAGKRGVLTYLPYDSHLSAEGHLIVAQQIASRLRIE